MKCCKECWQDICLACGAQNLDAVRTEWLTLSEAHFAATGESTIDCTYCYSTRTIEFLYPNRSTN